MIRFYATMIKVAVVDTQVWIVQNSYNAYQKMHTPFRFRIGPHSDRVISCRFMSLKGPLSLNIFQSGNEERTAQSAPVLLGYVLLPKSNNEIWNLNQ